MSWLFAAIPYLLAIGTIALGAFEIIKDWNDYEESRLKIAVASVFIVVAALSLLGLHHDNQEKQASKIEAENAQAKAASDMKVLQGKVDTANKAQAENTKMYVESFTKMSGQIGDLKSEVKTEALQKRLTMVQAELLKTQKAMAPGPKAELTFSFEPFPNPPPPGVPIPVKEVTVPLNSDGSIHVEFSILNLTSVDAVDNAIDLQICDDCKYAKEPEHFTKLPIRGESVRFVSIPTIHAKEAFQDTSLDIIPPAGTRQMELGFEYRCRTCAVHMGMTPEATGIIHIERP